MVKMDNRLPSASAREMQFARALARNGRQTPNIFITLGKPYFYKVFGMDNLATFSITFTRS